MRALKARKRLSEGLEGAEEAVNEVIAEEEAEHLLANATGLATATTVTTVTTRCLIEEVKDMDVNELRLKLGALDGGSSDDEDSCDEDYDSEGQCVDGDG